MIRSAAGLLLAVALLGACGGDGDGDGDGAESRPAPPERGRLAGDGDYPNGGRAPEPPRGRLETAAEAAGCEVGTDLPEEGDRHVVEPVEYESEPPTSGDHFVEYTRDGVYADPPSAEQLVHALEHGRVILQFNRGASDSVRGTLKAVFDADDYHVILTPSPTELPYEIAASAWRAFIGCERATPDAYAALRLFTEKRRDRAPEFFP